MKTTAAQYRLVETEFGSFGFVARDEELLATFLPTSKDIVLALISERFPDARADAHLLDSFAKDVRRYFRGEPVRFDVSVDLERVPPFHRKVYQQCRRIPFGGTASYQDLARAAGNEHAVRAVGTAMARNHWPLVVPCHRVVRVDGSLGGFSSPEGIEEKVRMLRLEGIQSRNGRIVTERRQRTTAVA